MVPLRSRFNLSFMKCCVQNQLGAPACPICFDSSHSSSIVGLEFDSHRNRSFIFNLKLIMVCMLHCIIITCLRYKTKNLAPTNFWPTFHFLRALSGFWVSLKQTAFTYAETKGCNAFLTIICYDVYHRSACPVTSLLLLSRLCSRYSKGGSRSGRAQCSYRSYDVSKAVLTPTRSNRIVIITKLLALTIFWSLWHYYCHHDNNFVTVTKRFLSVHLLLPSPSKTLARRV